jgi:hypothetical protein
LPGTEVQSAAPSPARKTQIRAFTLGRIRYNAISAETLGRYMFVSAAPGHVYDMRERRYGGQAGSISIACDPSFPGLVALSPYKIEAVGVRVNDSESAPSVQAGGVVKVTAMVKASQAPGIHAINFRVYGPDGKERRYYGKTLFGENGQAALELRTALNDAQGTWTIQAADLASGIVG